MKILKLSAAFLAVATLAGCEHHIDKSQAYCKADFTRRSAGIYDTATNAPLIEIRNGEIHSDGVMEGVPDHAVLQFLFVDPQTKICEAGNDIAGYTVYDLK